MHFSRSLFTGFLMITLIGGVHAQENPDPPTTNAKAAAFSAVQLSTLAQKHQRNRPSATLGVFTSLYVSQGVFLPVQTARDGVEAQMKLIQGQTDVRNSEAFSLLKELGAILQVDVQDTMNRSNDRVQTLNTYTRSLSNILELATRKQTELTSRVDELDDVIRERKRITRDLERTVDTALNEQDYDKASDSQEELITAEGALAESETEQKQLEDILDIYEELIGIGQERLNVIENNRRILISGLKVVELPGIEQFDIIETQGGFRLR